MHKRFLYILTALILFIFVFIGFLNKINLTNADLGRHLKNGQTLLKDTNVIRTNYYSYTNTSNPTLNHHWLTGVIFYGVWLIAGFSGLSIINAIIIASTILILFLTTDTNKEYRLALFIIVLALPVFLTRKEIRPESLSYLFISIYLFLYTKYLKDSRNTIALVFILLLQILWVNIHIFFVFGVFVSAVFLIKALLSEERTVITYQLALLVSVVSVSLINPFFINGLLEPLTIFKNFEYLLAENQSILFMHKRSPSISYIYYLGLFIGSLEIIYLSVSKKSIKDISAEIIILIVFGLLGMKAIRLFPLFSIALMYSLPKILTTFELKNDVYNKLYVVALIALFCLMLIPNTYFSLRHKTSGIGLASNVLGAKNFWQNNNLTGPIFNNYDIGGYLIYSLFPNEKVFVDNRPEAYPPGFFSNLYIPMQQNEIVWQEQDNWHTFNAIFFYRHDLTPWGQKFLIARFQDPSWIPVYVDEYNIIFLKDNEQNENIIKEFKLPDSMFSIVKN